jgi:predicted metal-binding protein
MTTLITICDTCKRSDWADRGIDQTDGERLAALVEDAAMGVTDVNIRRHSCLMGCGKGCNLAIQGVNKLTYVLGNFEALPEQANAIVEYARLHSQSETGQVAFKAWPQAIKGHFVSRLPALPITDQK